jgi:hypothetical protein
MSTKALASGKYLQFNHEIELKYLKNKSTRAAGEFFNQTVAKF